MANGGGSSRTSFRQTNNRITSNKPLQRTKYRKQLDEETIRQKALERQKKGQDPDWDVILNQTSADPLMFVDGYNIIFKWPRLKKHMTRGDTDKARRLLLDDLEQLASLKGWRIECVFDGSGYNRQGSGPQANTKTHGAVTTVKATAEQNRQATKSIYNPVHKTVRVVYTGRGVEADSYIQNRCAEAKNVTEGKITSSLMVATDDSMIRMAALNAGALCMSADRFLNELKAVRKAMQYRVEAAMAAVNGHVMRPEKLWGTDIFMGGGVSNKPKKELIEERADGTKLYVHRFGRTQLLIEDKRNRKKNKQNNNSSNNTTATTDGDDEFTL
jgi:predicted RNA-binding protein with PIN domain